MLDIIQTNTNMMETKLLPKKRAYCKCAIALICFVFFLSSCGHTTRVIYNLDGVNQHGSLLPLVQGQVLILQPESIKALNSDYIAVFKNGNEISYFGNVTWSDDLPNLLHAKLVEAFENSSSIIAGKRGQGILANFRIATTIRSFQIEEIKGNECDKNLLDQNTEVNGIKCAKVEFWMKIINNDGFVIAEKGFSSVQKIEKQGIKAAIEILNTTLNDVLSDILRWTTSKLS